MGRCNGRWSTIYKIYIGSQWVKASTSVNTTCVHCSEPQEDLSKSFNKDGLSNTMIERFHWQGPPWTRVMITEVILESLTGNLISQKQSCRDEMCRQKLKDWINSYHISHLCNSPCSRLACWIKGESTSFAPGMTNPLTPVCTVQLMVETPAPAKSLWSCIYHNGF